MLNVDKLGVTVVILLAIIANKTFSNMIYLIFYLFISYVQFINIKLVEKLDMRQLLKNSFLGSM